MVLKMKLSVAPHVPSVDEADQNHPLPVRYGVPTVPRFATVHEHIPSIDGEDNTFVVDLCNGSSPMICRDRTLTFEKRASSCKLTGCIQ